MATITGTKWGHELDQGKDQAKFDKDCVIQFKTAGKVIIKTYGAPYGAPENVKINYLNGIATVTIVATEAQPIQNGCYITLIQVDDKDIPAHVHEYGDWTVETVPTSSAIGAALKTCKNCESDPAHSVQIELPQLSETDYTISAGTSAGNSTYTYTTDDGDTIVFEAPTLAGMHVHNYGDSWTITATAESAGKATKTCTAEGECNAPTIEVEIPALNDSRYTITNNTATLEAAGTGTYSIEIDGETISFTAATPQLEMTEITTDTTFNFRREQPYKETINAGQTGNYGQLIIKGNTNGTFKSNNGDWYVIAGDATLEMKIKSGTTVTVQIGYCHDCLSFDFNGEAVVEGAGDLTKSEYAGSLQTYTFVANEDGILAISKTATASGTAYIGQINVTVPVS